MIPSFNLSGDELYYFSRSDMILELCSKLFSENELSEVVTLYDKIIDKGFFMPFSSILLAPFRALTDSIYLSRIYIFSLNLFLHFFICLKLFRLNKKLSVGFHFLSLLFPSYILGSFTFWGESIASKLIMIIFIFLFARSNRKVNLFSNWFVIRIGIVMAIACFARQNSLLVFPVILFVIVMNNFKEKLPTLTSIGIKSIKQIVLCILSFTLVYLWWPLSLTNKFESFYFTSTSVELLPIFLYGDSDLINEEFKGVKPRTTSEVYKHYLKKVDNDFKKFSLLVKSESDRLTSTITFNNIFDDAFERMQRIYLHKSKYELMSRARRLTKPKTKSVNVFYKYIIRLNRIIYPLLLFSTIVFLINYSKRFDFFGFLLKAFTSALLAHTMFLYSAFRHSIILYPFFILITVYLFLKIFSKFELNNIAWGDYIKSSFLSFLKLSISLFYVLYILLIIFFVIFI